jgi:ribonuclease D
LNELCIKREKMAERLNRPLFKVVDDRLLLKVALAEPRSLDQLSAAGLTDRQIQRFGRGLLEGVERGINSPLVHASEVERLSESVLNRMHKLKSWRKTRAEEMGVESDVILPRVYLHALAEQNPRTPEELEKALAGSPWRIEHFGPEIMRTLGVRAIPA